MAGRGPAPKPAAQRRRRNKAGTPATKVAPTVAAQPELPATIDWPQRTVEWWSRWAESPLAATFTASDWEFLLDTALIHAAVWTGSLAQAAELRLRVAKFGVTPEDRARLKIEFAAPEVDGKEPASVSDIDAWRARTGAG